MQSLPLMMIKLKLDALGKHYNHRWIFKDLNFESESTIIGISGANGSGKSTLLKILTGLVQPDLGKVEWIRPDSGPMDMRADTGYAAPYIQLYGDLTCRENLTFLQSSSEVKIDSAKLDALATEIGILEKLDRPYKSLSSGQQQRIKRRANKAICIIASNLQHELDLCDQVISLGQKE
jgi:ABC-type multidrug transport system ATPase subunit